MKLLEKEIRALLEISEYNNPKGVTIYMDDTPEASFDISAELPLPPAYKQDCTVAVSCDYPTIEAFLKIYQIQTLAQLDAIGPEQLLREYDGARGEMYCNAFDSIYWYRKSGFLVDGKPAFIIRGDFVSPVYFSLELNEPADFIRHAMTLKDSGVHQNGKLISQKK